MKFEELLQDAEKQGREEGREEGRKEGLIQGHEEGREEEQRRMGVLITRMTEAGEADKLSMLSDVDFLNKMFLKYQI